MTMINQTMLKDRHSKFLIMLAIGIAMAIAPFAGQASADIEINERESFSRLRVFAGSGGAVDLTDESDVLEDLTGVFIFSRNFDSLVTEENPLSNGAAEAMGDVSVMDTVVQLSPSAIRATSMRTSNGTVQHTSGTGNAEATPRHDFRVRFTVTDAPVRYTLTGNFAPGPIGNGANSLRMYRPFTANTFFEIFAATPLDETGILQPGLTYEVRVVATDGLSASAGNPGPTSEATQYKFEFNVATAILGDCNMDGVVNLLDVQPFIASLSSGEYLYEADVNQDGVVNLLDVNAFIDILNG